MIRSEEKYMKIKSVAFSVVSLVILASVPGMLETHSIQASPVIEGRAIQKNVVQSFASSTSRSPPAPPLMWTEDFFTYFIPVPENPDGDQTSYFIDWGDGTNTGWLGPYEPGVIVVLSHAWSTDGTYQLTATAKNQNQTITGTYELLLFPDFNLFYPTLGYIHLPYVITIHDEGYPFIKFDWGDGTYSDWLGPSDFVLANKSWDALGTFDMRYKARDIYGAETPWSGTFGVTIIDSGTQPPPLPAIEGPTWGIINVEYTFTVNTTNDWGYCWCNWGDGTGTEWLGPFEPGQPTNVSHAWSKRGVYRISMKFKDPWGAESDYVTHDITIYELKGALISGRYENMSIGGDFITIHAINLHLLILLPPRVLHDTAGENVTFFAPPMKTVIITPRFIVGFIRVVI